MRLSLQSYIYKGALKLDNIIGSSAKNLGSSKGNNHPWWRVQGARCREQQEVPEPVPVPTLASPNSLERTDLCSFLGEAALTWPGDRWQVAGDRWQVTGGR